MRDQINIPNDVVAEAFPAWDISNQARFGVRATSGRCFVYERKALWYALCQIPVIIVKALWYFVLKTIAAMGGAVVGAAQAMHSNFVGDHVETVIAKSPSGRIIYRYLTEISHRQFGETEIEETPV